MTRKDLRSAEQKMQPDYRETMSNDWQEGYRAAMNDAASVARELYMNHAFHTGTGGLLDRCKQAEQVFLSDAAAASAI